MRFMKVFALLFLSALVAVCALAESEAKSLTDYSLALSSVELVYTGESQTVAATVTDKSGEGYPLQAGKDYTVSGNEAVDAGTYTVTVSGVGDYTGELHADFAIVPADLQGMGMDAPEGGFDDAYIYAQVPESWTPYMYAWNGEAGDIVGEWPGEAMELVDSDMRLYRCAYPESDLSVNLVFSDQGDAQTADLMAARETVLGSVILIGAVQEDERYPVSLQPREVKRAVITLEEGSASVASVQYGDVALIPDMDYTAAYADADGNPIDQPTEAGTYTVIVSGAGNYTGSVELEFEL